MKNHPRGENPYDPMGPTDPDDEGTGKWLFMVYLDGANNLESAAVSDLNEMVQGAQNAEDIEIIVLIDRIDGFSTADGDWKDTRLYRINKNGKTRIAATIAGKTITASGASDDCNMGKGQTLEDFIKWCIANNTIGADKFVLDIWNHGGGWRTPEEEENLNDIRKPICWDDEEVIGNQHDTLFMNEVQQAIKSALSSSGMSKFNIIYMDACLMQLVEVCYELKNYCRYLIASEETVPGTGGDYTDIFNRYKEIYSQGKHTPFRFSYEIVSSYRNQYSTQDQTTLSSVDLIKIGNLVSALQTFGANLKNVNSGTLKTIRNNTHNFADVNQADLYHFAQLCNSDISGGVTGASSVMEAINAMMVKEYHYIGLGNCHGMSIYFPKNPSDTDPFYWNNNVLLYDGSNGNLDFDDIPGGNKWVEFITWWSTQ